MHMHMHMHIHIHVHMHMHMHIHIHMRITCTHAHMHTYTCTCTRSHNSPVHRGLLTLPLLLQCCWSQFVHNGWLCYTPHSLTLPTTALYTGGCERSAALLLCGSLAYPSIRLATAAEHLPCCQFAHIAVARRRRFQCQ